MAFKNFRVFSGQLTDNEVAWVQTGTGGVVNLKETTAPTPTSGYGKLYVKSSDSKLYFLDDSGVEHDLLAGGGGGYATIQEEGTSLAQRTIMNFIGAGITASDDAGNSRTNITLDATLNSISNLGTAADKTIYTTGVDTWAETTLTAFGRSLIDDADAPTARGTLGLGTIATQDANAVSITGGSITGITDLAIADGGTGASTAAGARTNLGLGDIAVENSPLAVAKGGTGASTAAGARVNLGLAIGTDVQAWDADLDIWATKTPPSGAPVGTTDTQDLSNKNILSAQNAQTGTSYTLVLSDAGKVVTMNNSAANTLTIPPNSSVAFPIGTKIMITQLGAGATTIATGSGVTLNNPSSVSANINEQYGSRVIWKYGTDTWLLV